MAEQPGNRRFGLFNEYGGVFLFSDKVVLVTGAAGGLGSAVSHFFKQMDAKVIVVDLEASLLETVFGSDKKDFHLFSVDLTKRDRTRAVFEGILIDHHRVDIVCNIAGGFSMGEPVHETSDLSWDFLFDLNVKSILHTSSVLVPHMIKNGGGKIVNVGARAALGGVASMGAYTASKSAVIRITEAMAGELINENINVNCILPGVIDTPTNRAQMPDADFSAWVDPYKIAEVVGFLCSEKSVSVSGASVPVYGRS